MTILLCSLCFVAGLFLGFSLAMFLVMASEGSGR